MQSGLKINPSARHSVLPAASSASQSVRLDSPVPDHWAKGKQRLTLPVAEINLTSEGTNYRYNPRCCSERSRPIYSLVAREREGSGYTLAVPPNLFKIGRSLPLYGARI